LPEAVAIAHRLNSQSFGHIATIISVCFASAAFDN